MLGQPNQSENNLMAAMQSQPFFTGAVTPMSDWRQIKDLKNLPGRPANAGGAPNTEATSKEQPHEITSGAMKAAKREARHRCGERAEAGAHLKLFNDASSICRISHSDS